MKKNVGCVFDIQHFSIHDGPGIRTTVFLKGCSNSCLWCHNPESYKESPQIQYFSERCVRCGSCEKACPISKKRIETTNITDEINAHDCMSCGLCAAVCPVGALKLTGRYLEVDDVVEQVMADKSYYKNSGGGLTLSGGEPVLQSKFCLEILKRIKAQNAQDKLGERQASKIQAIGEKRQLTENSLLSGVHTAIQTAGNYEYSLLKKLLPYLDLVMFDLKAISKSIYDQYIKADIGLVLENLSKLAAGKVPIVVRTPVIGPINDNEDEIARMAKYVSNLNSKYNTIKEYKLIPYHPLAKSKRDALGIPNCDYLYTPEKEDFRKLVEVAASYFFYAK